MPPRSSLQQQNPLTANATFTTSGPTNNATVTTTIHYYASTPLYSVSSFPSAESNYLPPVILSQYSYFDSIGSMHIVGEVLNQAPVLLTLSRLSQLYNANRQVIGTDFISADASDLAPGQRAPFDIIVSQGSVPMYQMSSYGLTVDSQ
jgi:hypothetical protein